MSEKTSKKKIYLNVPFVQKDLAKRLGAHFDFHKKSWYVEENQDLTPFAIWLYPENKLTHNNANDLTSNTFNSPSLIKLTDHTEKQSSTTSTHHLPSSLSLLYLMQMIKQSVQQNFTHPIWIHAEIAQIKKHRQHHYLELIERGEKNGEELAKIRATVWQNQQHIIEEFEQQTKKQLSTDLKIMLQVRCIFHERFGLSLNILQINAEYTLGQMQQKINAIRQSLQSKGIYGKNKEKELPKILHNICVISPENAAGLADFNYYLAPLIENQLCQCDYYQAIFQGNKASQNLSSCLQEILNKNEQKNYQLIVIIRGGGSIVDLQYLEEYHINELVCLATLPIWVGLGHQTDKLLINEVAHRHFPTPTAVAKQIIEYILSPLQYTTHQWREINLLSKQHLAQENKNIEKLHFLLHQYCHQLSQKNQNKLMNHYTALHIHTNTKIERIKQKIASNHYLIQQLSREKITTHKQIIQQSQEILKQRILSYIENLKIKLKMIHSLIQNSHPKKILKRGFAIIRDDSNQPLKELNKIDSQEKITIEMHSGYIDALVEKKSTRLKN